MQGYAYVIMERCGMFDVSSAVKYGRLGQRARHEAAAWCSTANGTRVVGAMEVELQTITRLRKGAQESHEIQPSSAGNICKAVQVAWWDRCTQPPEWRLIRLVSCLFFSLVAPLRLQAKRGEKHLVMLDRCMERAKREAGQD